MHPPPYPATARPFATQVVHEPTRWDQAQSGAVDAAEVGADSESMTVFIRSSLTGKRTALTPLAFAGFVADVKAGKFDTYLPR